jgi:hypothetical protein
MVISSGRINMAQGSSIKSTLKMAAVLVVRRQVKNKQGSGLVHNPSR